MDDFEDTLSQLGLTGHEPVIYAYLLKHTPSGASAVAKKCSLSRSSVYTSLRGLIEKGLVSVSQKSEVKQYIAHDYSAVEEMLQQQENQLNDRFSVLKNLKSDLTVTNNDEARPDVSFFEGQEGLKKVYLAMMRQSKKGDTLFLLRDEFVWQKDWAFIFQTTWSNRVTRIKQEKSLKTMLLVNDSKTERSSADVYKKKKGLDYRFLPKNDQIKDYAMYVLGDSVAIMSMERNHLVGILITNKNLADNHKVIFKNLWSISKR
ncbi:MAG: helix-turn-helix domain-containing protein [Patescibacteria group bacterium]